MKDKKKKKKKFDVDPRIPVPVESNEPTITRREAQRKVEEQVRKEIGKGSSDVTIMNKLGLKPTVLDLYKKRILDYDRDTFENYSNASVYSKAVAQAEQNIKDLDDIKVKFRNRGQWTALVAAIKQKHEISKDLFKMGQELGYIDKRVTEMKVENEFTFATMTTEDVKREVEKERAKLNAMANMNVIEMRPELMEMLDDDTEKIQKFIPANVSIGKSDDEKVSKKTTATKIKIKQKMKLKK